MKFSVIADNIKCGGCANRIKTQLTEMEGLTEISVDYETGEVCWQSEESQKETVLEKLKSMGYPEAGTTEGLAATGAKAKSYVSCAIGKMTESE